ncbi:MAG: ABC transporter permease, partial [Caldilineaceae bacterium]|nr:ABC transporter permease [Caldilineaceae bacterium]
MKKTLTIAWTDLQIFFRRRGNLLSIFVLPVAFTLVLGYSFSGGSGGPTRLRVDVLDEDQSARSAQFLDELRAANEALVLCPLDNNDEDFCGLEGSNLTRELGITRAENEETSGFLVIPAGYATALTQRTPLTIDYYSPDDPSFPATVTQAAQSVLEQVNSAVVAAQVGGAFLGSLTALLALNPQSDPASLEQSIYQAATQRLEQRPPVVHYVTTNADEGATINGIQSGFGQSVPGMGSMYVMFTVLGGTAILFRERRQWTLQRLATMPLSRAQILGGKILTYFTLGMIQYLVIFAVGLVVGLEFG